jgi:Tfp pilus assembly protein PilN
MAINLLPWRETLLVRKNRRYWLTILLTVMLISMITLIGRYYLSYLNHHYQLSNLHLTELIKTNQITDNGKQLSIDYQNIQQQIKLIRSVDHAQKRFWQELDFLQKSPPPIQFSNLTWVQNELQIQGYSSQADLIGLFIKNLEKSQLFSQVALGNLNQENKTGTIYFVLNSARIQEDTP